MSIKLTLTIEHFRKHFGEPDVIISAPGRANIIGEHIDYCEGWVLPFAIEQSMYFCMKSRQDNVLNVSALDLNQSESFVVDQQNSESSWGRYCSETLKAIKSKGYRICGANISFSSDIPIGGGVSSSSALCCGLIKGLGILNNWEFTEVDIIELSSMAEYGIGLQGGKMDQTAICFGRENHVIWLDCLSEKHEHISIDMDQHIFMLFDTQVHHSLADSEYNKRRRDIEEALLKTQLQIEEPIGFRGLNDDMVLFLKTENIVYYKRISHIISEMKRAHQALEAIKRRDFCRLGKLMNNSHASLTYDYDVSCPELDFLTETLQINERVLGARMMGGGFGGNVIALMKTAFTEEELERLQADYYQKYELKLSCMTIAPGKGLTVLDYKRQ